MARVTYKGFNLPDGAAIPDVPADLRTLVDGGFPPRFANQAALDAAGMNVVGAMAVLLDAPMRVVMFDGTNWLPIGHRLLGRWASTANGSATSATGIVVPGTSQTVTIGPGPRRIRADVQVYFQASAGAISGRLQCGMDGAPAGDGFSQLWFPTAGGPGQQAAYFSSYFLAVPAGNHTFDLRVSLYSGTGTMFAISPNTMYALWDVGT